VEAALRGQRRAVAASIGRASFFLRAWLARLLADGAAREALATAEEALSRSDALAMDPRVHALAGAAAWAL
jgi:hypothetical protein